MNRSLRLNRRFVLAAGAGAPLFAIGGADPARAAAPGRPDFSLARTGPDHWRWLSWRHDGICWRPVRGKVNAAGSALVVEGSLPPADRTALLDALGDAAAGRHISFAQEP